MFASDFLLHASEPQYRNICRYYRVDAILFVPELQ